MEFRLSIRTLAFCCLAPCLLTIAGQASAQASSLVQGGNVAPSLPRVDIAVVQNACDAMALQTKTLSWFVGSVTLVSARQEPGLDAGAVLAQSPVAGVRVWIVARTATTVWLYFAVQPEPGRVPRYLVRDIELDRGFDELGMEQVAQVVYLSSMALWTGQLQSTRSQLEDRLSATFLLPPPSTPGPRWSAMPTAVAAKSGPAPNKAWQGRSGWMLHSELAYGLRLQGREGIAQGPLGALRFLHASGDLELGGRLSVQFLLPHRQQSDPVVLDLRGYSIRAAPWLSFRKASDLSVTAELGPGMDVVRYSVKSTADPSLQPVPSQWEVRPIAWLAIGIESGSSRIRFGLEASLSVQLLRTHYDLVDGSQHIELLAPWIIQPGWSAHVVF